jgi:uncharacterized glyoxalase superfamily protein PhnB
VLDGDPIEMPDGRIGHAELLLGGERIMLADEYPEMNLLAPSSRGGTTVLLHLSVADGAEVDRLAARAVAAGATLERPVADSPYGRTGELIDPSGHRWQLMSAPAEAAPAPARPSPVAAAPKPGDVNYLTFFVRGGSERFREFYGAVLGWEFAPGRLADGWEPGGVTPATGVWGGQDYDALVPMFVVADLNAALEAVRAHGGRATEPAQQPYGRSAECHDDQNQFFYLTEG